MTRSGTNMVIASLLLALSCGAQAANPQAFDPRDPGVWEEKPENASVPSREICEVFASKTCQTPGWEDEKSDIQRERERREQQRMHNEYERRWRRE